MQPVSEKFFGVADKEIKLSWCNRLLYESRDTNVIKLALNNDFRKAEVVKSSSHESSNEVIFSEGLSATGFTAAKRKARISGGTNKTSKANLQI